MKTLVCLVTVGHVGKMESGVEMKRRHFREYQAKAKKLLDKHMNMYGHFDCIIIVNGKTRELSFPLVPDLKKLGNAICQYKWNQAWNEGF